MIDDYFPFGTFYKSTGDGLMVTVHFNRDTVVDTDKPRGVLNVIIGSCRISPGPRGSSSMARSA
jgi:hypothetical protein